MPARLRSVKRKPGRPPAVASQLPVSQDTVVRLMQDIERGLVDPKTLQVGQRRAVVAMLMCGKRTSAEMAAVFGVTASTIRMDLKHVREELGREVRSMSLEEVLGQLSAAKDKTAAMAMDQADPGLAWTIERDWVQTLRTLGVIGDGPRDGVRMTLEMVGSGYERAREALERVAPELVGQVPDRELEHEPGPLDRRLASLDPDGDNLDPEPERPSGP